MSFDNQRSDERCDSGDPELGGWELKTRTGFDHSDYAALIADLNPTIASYQGEFDNAPSPLPADLVIQSRHYEPFALTVGEALASRVPVVASSEVVAVEGVKPECCILPAGDLDAFERVRGLVARIREAKVRVWPAWRGPTHRAVLRRGFRAGSWRPSRQGSGTEPRWT